MSGYWPEADQVASAINPQVSPGPPTGIAENFDAANSDMLLANNSNSAFNRLSEAYADRIAEVYKTTGQKLVNPVSVAQRDDLSYRGDAFGVPTAYVADLVTHKNLDAHVNDFEKQVDQLRTQYPNLTTSEQMWQNLGQTIGAQERENAGVNARATFLGKIGSVAGSMAGAQQDPINMMTLPIGVGAAASILKTALLEAGIGASIETAIQPGVQEFRGKLGLEHGFKQGLENVAAAAGGRALLSTGIKALGVAADSGVGQAAKGIVKDAAGDAAEAVQNLFGKKLLSRFDSSVPNPAPEQKLARDLYGEVTDVNDLSPLDPNNPQSIVEHNDRLLQTTRALHAETAPQIPEQPAAALSSQALNETPEDKGFMQAFDPATIKTDAKTFQFKEGGDTSGVTERLQGVQKWDPVKAGMVIVYENNAGDRFIADGHQRLGLAQRIAAADPSQQISLFGPLFREADGFTPESVRVIAAMKNIAEGTGTAVDAAKVLRVDPARLKELPPRSALVRQAADMVNLTDHSFGYVVNDLVPANQAAIVGRLVPNAPELQEAIIGLLAKLEPENPAQAEAIVRQAMDAGTHAETQHSLFGEETVTSSLYGERAKVLDKTLKKLRLERKVFSTLVDNAALIEKEGNVVKTDQNAARAEGDARAQQLVQTLANRKGPLSDALTAAARRAAHEGKYTNATADFVAAVRSAVERGDFNGLDAGPHGRPAEIADENGARARPAAEAAPDEATLLKFDEPNGDGAQEQTLALEADLRRSIDKTDQGDQLVIPGAEQKTLQDVADQKASEKIKPDAAQQPANEGLFDVASRGQTDLLDMAVPVAERVDENGKVVSETKTVQQLLDEIDQDEKDLAAIGTCGAP